MISKAFSIGSVVMFGCIVKYESIATPKTVSSCTSISEAQRLFDGFWVLSTTLAALLLRKMALASVKLRPGSRHLQTLYICASFVS
jgi:hypothetical protein